MTPTSWAAHHGITVALAAGRRMLKGDCSVWSGTPVARHASSCSTVKLDTPIARILPARSSSSQARAVLLLAPHPPADRPGTEADRRDPETSRTERASLHDPAIIATAIQCRPDVRPRRGAPA